MINKAAERASKFIWHWSRMKEWGQKWDPVAKAAGGARLAPVAAKTHKCPT